MKQAKERTIGTPSYGYNYLSMNFTMLLLLKSFTSRDLFIHFVTLFSHYNCTIYSAMNYHATTIVVGNYVVPHMGVGVYGHCTTI